MNRQMDRWSLVEPFLVEAGYSGMDKLKASDQVSYVDALELIGQSINTSFAIFCFPHQFYEFSTYGHRSHLWGGSTSGNNRNYLIHHL
jgi:hypothetical protein